MPVYHMMAAIQVITSTEGQSRITLVLLHFKLPSTKMLMSYNKWRGVIATVGQSSLIIIQKPHPMVFSKT